MRDDIGDWLPLTGLRVVDTTDSSSWSSARLLADLGADVIRVERNAAPTTPLSATRHANKRSIICESVRELEQLLGHADVWFDSGGDDVDVASICGDHAQLVVVSSSAFGSSGAYAAFRGSHEVVYSLSGQLSMCRLPGRAPLLPPGQPAFEVAATMGVYSAGGALESAGRRCG